ncbi:UNVERIFIED_CONTAM: hypothetical protein FKN15_067285 [Acipenser sinensis]
MAGNPVCFPADSGNAVSEARSSSHGTPGSGKAGRAQADSFSWGNSSSRCPTGSGNAANGEAVSRRADSTKAGSSNPSKCPEVRSKQPLDQAFPGNSARASPGGGEQASPGDAGLAAPGVAGAATVGVAGVAAPGCAGQANPGGAGQATPDSAWEGRQNPNSPDAQLALLGPHALNGALHYTHLHVVTTLPHVVVRRGMDYAALSTLLEQLDSRREVEERRREESLVSAVQLLQQRRQCCVVHPSSDNHVWQSGNYVQFTGSFYVCLLTIYKGTDYVSDDPFYILAHDPYVNERIHSSNPRMPRRLTSGSLSLDTVAAPPS